MGKVTKEYHKLVRDRIPDIIRENGGVPKVRVLDGEAYLRELLTKLSEEVVEVQNAESGGDLVKEIGDVTEVLHAIVRAVGIDPAEVEALRLQRLASRGGFEKRLFLETVEEEASEPPAP